MDIGQDTSGRVTYNRELGQILVILFAIILWLVTVHHINGRTGYRVRVVETLSESGIVVPCVIDTLLQGRVTIATCCRGRHLHRGSGYYTILHAQLEEDILERSETVCRQQIVRRLFGQQVTRTHQANLKIEKNRKLENCHSSSNFLKIKTKGARYFKSKKKKINKTRSRRTINNVQKKRKEKKNLSSWIPITIVIGLVLPFLSKASPDQKEIIIEEP